MSITLTLSETVAKRLATIADAQVGIIGQRLITDGSSALGAVMSELREMMELVSAIEAAGINGVAPQVAAPAPKPAVQSKARPVKVAEPVDEDAPHPAVLEARAAGSTSVVLRELMKGEAKSF